MSIRCLIVPLTMAVFAVQATPIHAQGAFPAPLPGARAPTNDPAFPPVNGAAPSPMIGAPSAFPPVAGGGFAAPPAQQAGPPGGDECMNGFVPLREDAARRGALIKKANDRHATPDVACRLFGDMATAELKMINYIDSHAQKCGIPPQVGQQLKAEHTKVEEVKKRICDAAQQQQARGPAGPSLSDVLGSSTALPEATSAKKSGGTTFDTLQGNVLSR